MKPTQKQGSVIRETEKKANSCQFKIMSAGNSGPLGLMLVAVIFCGLAPAQIRTAPGGPKVGTGPVLGTGPGTGIGTGIGTGTGQGLGLQPTINLNPAPGGSQATNSGDPQVNKATPDQKLKDFMAQLIQTLPIHDKMRHLR